MRLTETSNLVAHPCCPARPPPDRAQVHGHARATQHNTHGCHGQPNRGANDLLCSQSIGRRVALTASAPVLARSRPPACIGRVAAAAVLLHVMQAFEHGLPAPHAVSKYIASLQSLFRIKHPLSRHCPPSFGSGSPAACGAPASGAASQPMDSPHCLCRPDRAYHRRLDAHPRLVPAAEGRNWAGVRTPGARSLAGLLASPIAAGSAQLIAVPRTEADGQVNMADGTPNAPSLRYAQLFRYATLKERGIVTVGCIAAAATGGWGLPPPPLGRRFDCRLPRPTSEGTNVPLLSCCRRGHARVCLHVWQVSPAPSSPACRLLHRCLLPAHMIPLLHCCASIKPAGCSTPSLLPTWWRRLTVLCSSSWASRALPSSQVGQQYAD